ncbi:hypothetical protein Efla_004890 [Eimeria flavescens]
MRETMHLSVIEFELSIHPNEIPRVFMFPHIASAMMTPAVKVWPRGFESVREYRVFEESVQRELKCLKVCEHFQRRPGKCAAIAEKVTTRRHPAVRKTEEEPEYADIVAEAQDSFRCSTEKVAFPVTSAQEIGWIIKKHSEKEGWRTDGTSLSAPRCAADAVWRCPLAECDIVKSFKNYVAVMRVNMFAKPTETATADVSL